MSITSLVAPQLPLLRRYARALSGTQTSGDFYVLAMLETLVADPDAFERDLEPRVAAYRLLSRIWNSITINRQPDFVTPVSTADRHVKAITPLPRQAFLLTAVEGFNLDQTADILGMTPQEVLSLIDMAGREIGHQMQSSVLVVEDEPIIAMDLEALITGLGHKVVGNARTHSEAVAMARATNPGLVLADVRLADGSSGLAAVNEILETFEVPVIFITAYPESLLTGQCPEPTFLIAKPFREDTVRAVVSQALFFGEAAVSTKKPQIA